MMKKDNARLRELFLSAACPTIVEFEGIYEVEMLTRFKLPPNFKMISGGKGHNLLYGCREWGHFELNYGLTWENELAILFDYNTEGNVFTGRIRDYVRRLENGRYIGAFNWVIFGKPRFAGYFYLTAKWKVEDIFEEGNGLCIETPR